MQHLRARRRVTDRPDVIRREGRDPGERRRFPPCAWNDTPASPVPMFNQAIKLFAIRRGVADRPDVVRRKRGHSKEGAGFSGPGTSYRLQALAIPVQDMSPLESIPGLADEPN